jgi:hypothetical protein
VKLWSDFYDFIASDLPGCPFAAIDIALKQSAIDFCSQSLAWRYNHPDIEVTSGTAQYAFVPPAEAVVHAIHYAAWNGDEIATRVDESNVTIYDWRNDTGTPRFVFGGATSLTLVPTPDADGTLALEVILKPAPDATGVDDSIFNEFREAIVRGALSRLMLSPKKPYSNPTLAAYHQQQFTVKTAAAGTRSARNYTRSPLQTSILKRG